MDIMESQQIAISIHTSTREVTARDRGRFGAVIYFNPHFHKGSDLTIYAQHDFKLISIHTSTREVTEWLGPDLIASAISIHTSTREVTVIL